MMTMFFKFVSVCAQACFQLVLSVVLLMVVFGLVDVTVSGTHFHTIASDTPEVINTRGQPLITGTVGLVRVTSVA